MPRSSPSVAALACALAKAQAELVNPEKSLTGVVRSGRVGEGDRSFRYAPLSSGLEIVRKTLGKHEIATVQTTTIEGSLVQLTTMLAHTSGEWIASDWPVCPTAETANPQRMGAALTYARRYSLFTLVGIAGEDDLDAPDLNGTSPTAPVAKPIGAPSNGAFHKPHSLNGRTAGARDRSAAAVSKTPALSVADSAKARVAMLAEIELLTSSSEATAWARPALAIKNSLTTDDARTIESAFETKTVGFAENLTVDPSSTAPISGQDVAQANVAAPTAEERRAPILKPLRHRNKQHLRFVASQPCLVCGRQPCDAHHLRFAESRAFGRKVSDEFTVPLCRTHHREAHGATKEIAWWQKLGIAPLSIAVNLWRQTQLGTLDRE